jgi:RNA recognition motif-containing protein
MQWQDLKDLLRPAGSIIRAESVCIYVTHMELTLSSVAAGPDGRPRGYGTVLFQSEQDAARAVSMFNEWVFI